MALAFASRTTTPWGNSRRLIWSRGPKAEVRLEATRLPVVVEAKPLLGRLEPEHLPHHKSLQQLAPEGSLQGHRGKAEEMGGQARVHQVHLGGPSLCEIYHD